ncbi:hypothetical protein [Paenibacillus alvei]|uniref:Uncharacterized protein n=1 Tax=Paenibacillus alvei TaxID=44250 RepID=A0AAP7DK04_PAEAL|nr:hypothetical protein [Paenibacillus alvei]NOJ72144.1 hypothetical protein [Paenibacillus alvei]
MKKSSNVLATATVLAMPVPPVHPLLPTELTHCISNGVITDVKDKQITNEGKEFGEYAISCLVLNVGSCGACNGT